MRFVSELEQHLERVTRKGRSTNSLIQRLSVAVQRGNSASVLGTMDCSAANDLFRINCFCTCLFCFVFCSFFFFICLLVFFYLSLFVYLSLFCTALYCILYFLVVYLFWFCLSLFSPYLHFLTLTILLCAFAFLLSA